MTLGWSPVRLAWALFGTVVLVAGGAGTYVALQRDAATVPERGSVLRMHASPRVLPEIAFVDGTGRPRTLSDFRGRTVLLNVWATWCPPCREEMPSLDRLQKSLGGPGFEVVALSLDAGGADEVKRFYQETGIGSLAIYVDPGMRATAKLATPGVPTTLLIDAKGRELGRHAGPAQWDGEEAMRAISRHVVR